MKTKILSLILFIFPVWGMAQNNTITIQEKNNTLENVIAQIEQQTDYSVAYNPAEIDINKPVSVSLTRANINQAFTQILKDTEYGYKITGYHIIISPKKPDDNLPQAILTQTIRGKVVDAQTSRPIEFASIVLVDNPAQGATTDSLGHFYLPGVLLGRHDFLVNFIGYKPFILKEILVTSSKEVFLDVSLQENTVALREVIVTPQINKQQPLNLMTTNSARMFSVEEANRYAGGFDDPARLVTAFAGVAGGMQSNAISVRGNSPQFLQWRLEGVEAVNPTHYPDITGAGGGVFTALSSHVLGNSDFLTGAFPAEYGNALAGVFDMQLRNGNNQQYEHTAKIGTLGVEFGSEGPFKKGGKASYIFNYRYSTMALASDLLNDEDIAREVGGMRYQDLSFKLNFPTKHAGTFSVWGVGVIDHFIQSAPKDTADWGNTYEVPANFRQNKAAGGVGHKIFVGEKSYLKSALVANYTQNKITGECFTTDWNATPVVDMRNTNWNVTFNSFLNTKLSAAHTNRTGINVTGLFYDLNYWLIPDIYNYPPGDMVNYAKGKGNSMAYSAFTQSALQLTSSLTANVGLHGTYFQLNEKAVIEPRAGIRWQAFREHAFGLAYGKHSRRENLDYYFVETPPPGSGQFPNKRLDFAKAHHLVLSYDWVISEHIRLKVEPYYQYLYHIPVEENSTMSIINYRDWFMTTPLVSQGKGKNYGIDLTLERYLHKGYYYLFTASLLESRYKGGDGVWRNTRFNRNYIFNALGGKEWKVGKQKQNMLSLNLRFTLQGGERYIPVDEAASINEQKIVYDYSRAYEPQNPAEFLTHFTFNYKINRQKISHEFSVQMINVTGSKEYSGHYLDLRTGKLEQNIGTIMLPNISYKIEF